MVESKHTPERRRQCSGNISSSSNLPAVLSWHRRSTLVQLEGRSMQQHYLHVVVHTWSQHTVKNRNNSAPVLVSVSGKCCRCCRRLEDVTGTWFTGKTFVKAACTPGTFDSSIQGDETLRPSAVKTRHAHPNLDAIRTSGPCLYNGPTVLLNG